MICKTCGNTVSSDDMFCGVCGARVEHEPEFNGPLQEPEPTAGEENGDIPFDPSSPYGSTDVEEHPVGPPPKPRNNAKIIGIAVGIGVAVIVAIIVAAVIFFRGVDSKQKAPIRVDLNNYISDSVIIDFNKASLYTDSYDEYKYSDDYSTVSDYDFKYEKGYENSNKGAGLIVTGYSENASVSADNLANVIDWKKLETDVNVDFNAKLGYENASVLDYIGIDSFTFSVNKSSGVKNGDKLTVEIKAGTITVGTDNEITFEFKDGSKEYSVSGLQTFTKFNPFSCISVKVSGIDGAGNASWNVDGKLNKQIGKTDIYVVNKTAGEDGTLGLKGGNAASVEISFYILADNGEFSNGDSFTLYLNCDDPDMALMKNNLLFEKESELYTVNKLLYYVDEDFTFSEKAKTALKNKTVEEYNKKYGKDPDYSNLTYEGMYMYTADDYDDYYDEDYANCVIVAYSCTHRYEDSWYYYDDDDVEYEYETEYFYCEFHNILGDSDGLMNGVAADYFYTYNESSYDFSGAYSTPYDYTLKQIE